MCRASKAALISFSETLRTELGSAIGITIVTPGVIKTRMIENQDIFESFIPKGSAQGCAKAIVSGACRGDLYVTEPAWFWWLFPAKVTSPEVMEWFNRLLLMTFIEHISAKRKAAKGKISEGKSS
uniref:Uncharacterized protein n=1 Tax=Ficus carica TaxID=3494 RepID=A0AA87YNK7_FICCA|nr:hypothetical protein TIFTF001_048494 [Ficus carica]GMN18665.1 hypothetical protein TIFTF001_048501 [Ficus carica]